MSADASVGIESERRHGQAPAHVELVRVIDRTIHVSPIDRRKEVDYTIQNDSDTRFNFIFLPLRRFERNLQVYDEDGVQLNVYPNAYVEDMLGRVKQHDEEGYQRLEHRFKQADYKLFIQLPLTDPSNPGATDDSPHVRAVRPGRISQHSRPNTANRLATAVGEEVLRHSLVSRRRRAVPRTPSRRVHHRRGHARICNDRGGRTDGW